MAASRGQKQETPPLRRAGRREPPDRRQARSRIALNNPPADARGSPFGALPCASHSACTPLPNFPPRSRILSLAARWGLVCRGRLARRAASLSADSTYSRCARHASLQPRRHRAQVATLLGRAPDVRHAAAARAAEALRARHVPLSQRRRAARRPSRGLHGHRHRLPLRADAGQQRAAPDGLGRLRPAGRAARQAKPARPRGSPPKRTSTPSAGSSRCSASATTGTASWPRPTPTTSAGRSGSSCSCSTPGSIATQQQRPADRRAADSRRGGRRRATTPCAAIRTSIAWPIKLEAPVNWCPALGTVLANEEVIDGMSERGGHPVVRMPLRQWMLRITAYADRLENDLERARLVREHQGPAAQLDRPQHRRRGRFLHRPRAGHATASRGPTEFKAWRNAARSRRFPAQARRRRAAGLHHAARHAVRRHLHGARARASARRAAHAPEQAAAVEAYCEQAARKSDLDRTDLAKEKTGVFTGSYRGQPGERPTRADLDRRLRADQLRHRRDHGRAGPRHARLRVRPAVRACRSCRWSIRGDTPSVDRDDSAGRRSRRSPAKARRSTPSALQRPADRRVQAARSPPTWPQRGLGRAGGQLQAARLALQPAALLGRAVSDPARARRRRQADRPASAPCRPTSCRSTCRSWTTSSRTAAPSRRWSKAPDEWLYSDASTASATSAKRTPCRNGPARAGTTCGSSIRRTTSALVDPRSRTGLDAGRPVHRRRRARGAAPALRPLLAQGAVRPRHVSTPEPFQKLVNQGMILGEDRAHRLSATPTAPGSAPRRSTQRRRGPAGRQGHRRAVKAVTRRRSNEAEKRARASCSRPIRTIRLDSRAYKMSKSRGNVVNPDDVVARIRRRLAAAVRNVHGPAGSHQALEHGGRQRRARLSGPRLADDRRRAGRSSSS